jgi:hypothetical protein
MSGGWERYIREYNTRRQFLRRAGFVTVAVGAGPTLLAACGGDDDDESAETSAG